MIEFMARSTLAAIVPKRQKPKFGALEQFIALSKRRDRAKHSQISSTHTSATVMSHDKELEIRYQFLDEAHDYLDTLDAAIVGLSNQRVDLQKINAALRAAHSIKGGAAMMEFHRLQQLAHRLEDSFKVLKTQKDAIVLDASLENLLLSAVDGLRAVIEQDRHALLRPGSPQPSGDAIAAIFHQLHDRLGDPPPEDAASVLAIDSTQDIIPLLFETEVEGCLQRLESVLADANQPCLREELSILAQELGGLGEMLQLDAFCQLCGSVTQCMQAAPANLTAIAQAALEAWRKSQQFVLAGQLDQLPTSLQVEAVTGIAAQPVAIAATPAAKAPTKPAAEPFRISEFSIEDVVTAAVSPAADFQLPPHEVTWEMSASWDEVLEATTQVEPDEVEPDEVEPEPAPFSHRQTASTAQTQDVQRLEIKLDADSAGPDADQTATVRVSMRQLNQINDLFSELTIERNGLDVYLKRLRNLAETLVQRVHVLDESNAQMRTVYDRITPHSPALLPLAIPTADLSGLKLLAGSSPVARDPRFDALELDYYTDLHSLSQQVMETIVQVQELTSDIGLSLDDAEQTARDLSKTTRRLQTHLTQIRMSPLSDLLDRFPRALRELCLQYGKQVRLEVIGGDTLIDRSLLEALHDPLMHLLRNAFDHGIEMPDARRAAGKPDVGVITIAASQQDNRTQITISDDGNGISLLKVRQRAAQMGLDPTLLAAASDAELLSLIFEPGFSTSDSVTALSGRGVGMDVVRESVRQMRGEIQVDTRAGVGTTFTVSVPFTLSVIQALLVESHGMLMALPTDAIAEARMINADDVINTFGNKLLNWQGTLVPIIRLSDWLHFNCPQPLHTLESPPSINADTVLLVQHNHQRFAIQVERSWGEQEVAIRRPAGNLPMPSGFTGCAIVADGRVIPFTTIAELLNWITRSATPASAVAQQRLSQVQTIQVLEPVVPPPQLSAAPVSAPTELPAPTATILVVDDSINVRRLLAFTLERSGFQVEQAKDGQEALERLQRGLAVQVVICDVEMPRLDGYGFLAKLKSDPTLEHVPVAMLTSRSSEKHRQLAFSLGATAYFSKPYNEQLLLRTLEEIIDTTHAVQFQPQV